LVLRTMCDAQREQKMSEMESLIREIRQRLNASKDEGSINPLAVVTDLADRYSISEREIFALLTKEADAACINYLD
jgi:hypothetical protein